MLSKLPLRNIRRSLKDYAIYFFTLVLGVALFYVFNSLESQTVMLNVSARTHELVDLMNGIMPVFSVFVAVVLGFLIIYASRFLMKRRKKEFGIYMTLGMGKAAISRILLLETILIGLVSLAIGLLIGIGLSQLMSIFVANLFDADMTRFQFVFSPQAFGITILLFAVIYLIVMIFNTISIGRQKLINLIHADRQNEQIKVKNLAITIIVFILAAATLSFAYLGVTVWLPDLDTARLILYVVAGIIGTFLLFWSLSGLALRIFMRIRPLYYRGLNLFILREVNSKINTTVVSMSIISLLLFFTISIFSTAMSLNRAMNDNLAILVPADFQASKSIILDDPELPHPTLTARETLNLVNPEIQQFFANSTEVTSYEIPSVTYRQTMLANDFYISDMPYAEAREFLNTPEYLMPLSEYRKLAQFYQLDPITLATNQYAVVANNNVAVEMRERKLADQPTITVAGTELTPASTQVTPGFRQMYGSTSESGFLVVPDAINLSSATERQTDFIANYAVANPDDPAEKQAIEQQLTDLHIIGPDQITNRYDYRLAINTKIDDYARSIGLSAMGTYVGLYLGTIFLIASAALLGLKEISESTDNQSKYLTLRQLGTDQRVLNRTLFTQISIFFGLPLLVACLHSIFGIAFAHSTILSFTSTDLLTSILITASFLLAIYGGYFLITYLSSRRIVMNRD